MDTEPRDTSTCLCVISAATLIDHMSSINQSTTPASAYYLLELQKYRKVKLNIWFWSHIDEF